MITPSFNLTATERVLPKLALDFTTASLDSRITFTRSLNTATRVNSSGYIETVNADLPRFDYDPVTLACKGLLVEETRQNIALQSEDFGTTWAGSAINLDTNTIASPANTQTAKKIIPNTTSTTHFYAQTIATTNGTVYTASIYLKAGGYNWAVLYAGGANVGRYFGLETGTIGNQFVAAPTTSTITPAGNGWYRCTITFTATASTALRVYVNPANGTSTYAGNGTDGVYPWGAQLEAGAFATSYIPTTTTALTRNADVAVMTGTNFSDWFNASEGTLFVDAVSNGGYVFTQIGIASNTNDRIALLSSSPNFAVASGSTASALLGGTVLNNGVRTKMAGAYKLNDFAMSLNGATPLTDNSGNLASPNSMLIGARNTSSPNAHLCGTVGKINYYNIRLTNAELQAITK